MKHLTGLLYTAVRLFRPTTGAHASPLGWFRELRTEWAFHRPRRAQRVRRYAERIPAPTHAPAATGLEPHSGGDPTSPWVPAPRRPSDPVDTVNVSVPAAIVRGRCFISGQPTGARPTESRMLALAVLCALADQGQGQGHVHGGRLSQHPQPRVPTLPVPVKGFAPAPVEGPLLVGEAA